VGEVSANLGVQMMVHDVYLMLDHGVIDTSGNSNNEHVFRLLFSDHRRRKEQFTQSSR
jgi:hypothetical protein